MTRVLLYNLQLHPDALSLRAGTRRRHVDHLLKESCMLRGYAGDKDELNKHRV